MGVKIGKKNNKKYYPPNEFTKDRAKRTIQITTKFKWPNLELLAKFPAKKFEKVGISAAERAKSTKQDSRQFETNRQKSPTSTTFPSAKIWKRRRNSGTGEWVHFSRWGFGFEASQGRKTKTMQSLLIFQILARFLKVALCPFPSRVPKPEKQIKIPKRLRNQDSPILRVPKKDHKLLSQREKSHLWFS